MVHKLSTTFTLFLFLLLVMFGLSLLSSAHYDNQPDSVSQQETYQIEAPVGFQVSHS